jgi:Fic family protein
LRGRPSEEVDVRGTLAAAIWRPDPASYNPSRSARRPCSYEAFTPELLAGQPETLSGETVGLVSEAEQAVRELDALDEPALGPLARLLLRTESIASSRIEEMQVSTRDLARAEARAETGRKPGTEAAEILANIDAMTMAIEVAGSTEEIGEDEVVAIHKELMRHSSTPQIAGQIRREQNWIGGNRYNPCGAAFVPPPPMAVDDLLSDLYRAINEDHLSPVVQAAIVHAQFETVHPFADGNGRVGRTLVHVTLRRRGLAQTFVPPISLALAGDKQSYVDGLTAFRDGDLDTWVSRFAEATTLSVALAQQYLQEVADLAREWRARLEANGKVRSDAVAWALIDALPAHPMITAPVATAITGRSKVVVGAALDQLEAAGVLEQVGGGARNRCWEAVGLLDLIETLEARTARTL